MCNVTAEMGGSIERLSFPEVRQSWSLGIAREEILNEAFDLGEKAREVLFNAQ